MKFKMLPALAAGTLMAAGAMLSMSTPAMASSAGCAFTNGCATLHGYDSADQAVAMDAKYKNPDEILIGYPDYVGDNATSFDSVLHYAGKRPFYTFVYAANGVWSDQCVTDFNGSGALKLETCTLGKNRGQDFFIGSTDGLLDGSPHLVQNWLASEVSMTDSCLTDPSTAADASVPQSDPADEVIPSGRQLYVNGSCSSEGNLWSWNT